MNRIVLFLVVLLFFSCKNSTKNQTEIKGLTQSVEVLRDQWGINHIYAKNQRDLFFAQGYTAAKDRLFQFEIWRRQATGTVSEILGERALKRDIGTRLFKFRGDMTQEMNHYHDEGVEIISAYTEGVNAYIDEILKTPELLPIEFKALNIVPEKWTPEVVISRHQGLLGNIEEELEIGRAVAKLGVDKVKDLYWFHPKDPEITLDPKIETSLLFDDILELYQAYRKPVAFKSEDIIPEYRASNELQALIEAPLVAEEATAIGSNNWVIGKSLMADGNTYMANDPHRRIAVPSLRYMSHLVAPGWDVIGGGEPEIPGISIGHNQFGSWGLTVFETDGEDLYVYDLNPDNINQYKYKDTWVDMQKITETIKVKGEENVLVDLFYTRHGPVTLIDEENLKAYAIRCAWLEPGGSPYLASLRMDQAKTWQEFREACKYSHIPGENMVWADNEGNIGWQAVGIAPLRNNFSGLVPIPGDGSYEWDGYLPILEKPNMLNPPTDFFSTANQNVTPESYEHWNAIGFTWADPFRGDRVNEVIAGSKKLSMNELQALQTDYFSIPARQLVPYLKKLSFTGMEADAIKKLDAWDYKLTPNSIAAGIYIAFENNVRNLAFERFVPEDGKTIISRIQLKKIIDWIVRPDQRFGSDPNKGRDEFLIEAFKRGISDISTVLGNDMTKWQYGQEKFKHVKMTHALSKVITKELQEKLDLGPLARGGNAYTPGSTGLNNNQSSGASFRMIINTGNWDDAIATNGPGQSGDPKSPFYDNLFEPWAKDQYFPVYYSLDKIKSVTVKKLLLTPKD